MTMATTARGTATAAQVLLFVTAAHVPTVSAIPRSLEAQVRSVQKLVTRSYTEPTSGIADTPSATVAPRYLEANIADLDRETTSCEEMGGEIRGWSLLEANWDGEGAVKPSSASMKEAVSFVRLLGEIPLPEPMILASGHAALYWNDGALYADLEFLGDGRIAYFIKCHGDKHKGVLAFNSEEMPVVFQALIKI